MFERREAPALVRSGRVVIDTARRQARLDGRLLEISGLPLRILEELIRAQGRTVTRLELKRKLWPHAERIDIERRLNTAVRALREALGDAASEPRLVRTLRGHGYLWIGGEGEQPRSRSRWQVAAAASLALIAGTSASFGPFEPAAVGPPQAMDWHWRSSEASYRTQLRRNPSDFDARRRLAWIYVNEGRPRAALPQLAALVQTHTADVRDRAELGWLLLRAGEPAAALLECGAGELSINLLSCRQTALARLGLVSEARDVAVALMSVAHADAQTIKSVANPSPPLGYAQFLKWRVNAFVRPNRDWFQRAQLEADAGMYAEALASLHRAAAGNDPLLVKINSTAEFVPLHGSSEYRRLAAQVSAKALLS